MQLDFRFNGNPDRFVPLAKELVAAKPDVIFAQTSGAVAALQRETSSIPVVFANVSDPIGAVIIALRPCRSYSTDNSFVGERGENSGNLSKSAPT